MGIFARSKAPILTPADIDLSGIKGGNDAKVIGVCNAAVADLRISGQGDKIILFPRVIIEPIKEVTDPCGPVPFCYWCQGELKIGHGMFLKPKRPEQSLVIDNDGKKHQRHTSFLAKVTCSHDFSRKEIEVAGLLPQTEDEVSGVEDGRAVWFEDKWHLAYTAVSPTHGICVAHATTLDWQTFDRRNIIFADPNKDACLLPERINGEIIWFHRPSGEHARPSIWLGFGQEPWRPSGPDLFVAPRPGMSWEQERIGISGPPFRANGVAGEFIIPYHGRSKSHGTYGQGFIFARFQNGERKIVAQSKKPALGMNLFRDVHKKGLVPRANFSCGQVVEPDGRCIVIVSRADTDLWLAETTIPQILKHLEV